MPKNINYKKAQKVLDIIATLIGCFVSFFIYRESGAVTAITALFLILSVHRSTILQIGIVRLLRQTSTRMIKIAQKLEKTSPNDESPIGEDGAYRP